MTRLTPSRASDAAQPLPNPFDAAHTSAVLPRMPRSISAFLERNEEHAADHQRRAGHLPRAERLAQAERAHYRHAHWADGADQRELGGADAPQRLGLQE